MKSQVLDPLSQNQPGRYQRYDWPTDRLAEWHDVPVAGTVIVEGVSALRHELGRYWDLAIWVTCSHAVRLKRGIARDGEASRRQWEDVWIPEEDAYVAAHKPQERADVVVSGEEPYVRSTSRSVLAPGRVATTDSRLSGQTCFLSSHIRLPVKIKVMHESTGPGAS